MDLSKVTADIRDALDIAIGTSDAARERNKKLAEGVAKYLDARGYDVLSSPLEPQDFRLEDVKISPHIYHSLRRHGCVHVRDLAGLTEADVDEWPRFGLRSKRELIAFMDDMGLEPKPSEWPTFDVFGAR